MQSFKKTHHQQQKEKTRKPRTRKPFSIYSDNHRFQQVFVCLSEPGLIMCIWMEICLHFLQTGARHAN